MSPRARRGPEPNFGRLVSEKELREIVLSAHSMQRFVQRLAPDLGGADQVAEAMAHLEGIGSGRRSGEEQAQLARYRYWMTKHVQPLILELIRCEGFWATERPRWSRSRTPSDGYLQVGGMCLFPAAVRGSQIVLITCTNGDRITWDLALERGYTLMPKPGILHTPEPLRAPSWLTILAWAWRARRRHDGLIAAARLERARALEDTRLQNRRRQADPEAPQRMWREQRDTARTVFRERHR
jgi:hypothetical protein